MTMNNYYYLKKKHAQSEQVEKEKVFNFTQPQQIVVKAEEI